MQEIIDPREAIAAHLVMANGLSESMRSRGLMSYVLLDSAGRLKARGISANLITQYGDQWYGERAWAVGSNNVVTGMRLGTGTTTAAKTGAGAAIVTYVTGSAHSIDGGYPTSSLVSGARAMTVVSTWAPGAATANGIAEAVLTNEAGPSDSAGNAGNTVSRALLDTVRNKAAGDTLALTWTHTLQGS